MIDAVKYNLSHLTDFSGRDARPTFWWYVLFLAIVQFGIGILISIPVMTSSMASGFSAARSGADQATLEAQMMQQMSGSMVTMGYISAAVGVVVTLMGLAAFVRRLHDSGKTGWWAAIPLATKAITVLVGLQALTRMTQTFAAARGSADLEAMQSQVMAASWVNLVGIVGIVVIIAFGVMKSDPAANRYGEEPVRLGA
ncbi:DUF805 domain-containing protein [Aurantiacibacter spongiae]|nr:DUF805 domain-containing protein [Aurantiacibacter spongiae]